mmetsp:Transcript_6661/g.10681  ORF Transcript_6661/g.10681 Transcript_6661/m.10681 type:complete len:208 (-) Transcript_6661:139-762(-)|eukprot:CAMPEP_0169167284 /NCGR_PEP_ID=MMETSP1015-20121227/60396_1 /TAXON_ID=342587 /ORGANISM="Karlodinium micrum, Strain CCMP2283" /LENGTH=207 /DNA_ID=CAMNT_0009239997 /DNA_START=75 /DNA_END=698 /DNA_ORIENTATION=+
MSYSRGVLVHNFNEDQFGLDLASKPKPLGAPMVSVSHTVHHWKQPVRELLPEAAATQGVDRHILFGHTGDMRDPHTNLQKTEFAPASAYFMQDPATLSGVGHLSADGFTISMDPTKVVKEPSLLAQKVRQRWGDGRQTHMPTADERFMTSSRFAAEQGAKRTAEHQVERMVPESREFSQGHDQVKLLRSNFRRGGENLRSAGQLLAQ